MNPEHCNAHYNLGVTLIRAGPLPGGAGGALPRAGVLRARRARRGLHRRHPLQPGGRPLRTSGAIPRRSRTSGRACRSRRTTPAGAHRARRMPWPAREKRSPGTPRGDHDRTARTRSRSRSATTKSGPSRLVRPATLLDYLQDAAAEHASILRIGVQELHHRDLTWVLSRLRLSGGSLRRGRRNGARAHLALDPGQPLELPRVRGRSTRRGQIVARATTAWVVLDLVRRRPVRIADVLPDYPLEPRRAIADDFPPLPRPERSEREVQFTVRQSDLDMNRHVNNAVYVGWALESAPEQVAADPRAGGYRGRLSGRGPGRRHGYSPAASRRRAPIRAASCTRSAGKRTARSWRGCASIGPEGPVPALLRCFVRGFLLLLFLLPALAHQAGAAPADRDGHEEEQGDQQPEGGRRWSRRAPRRSGG